MGKITLEEYIELFRKKAEQMGEFPDKVIINALTGTATRHRADKAQAITTVLQNMLVDPNHPAKHKLPICYLVDSIVKNISDPYADLFEVGLTHWFCGAYDAVDDKSKRHLARVLATWEVQSIFSADKRKEIQRHILNSQPNASSASSSIITTTAAAAASSPLTTSTSVASAPATSVTTVHPPLPGAPPLPVSPPPVSTAVPYSPPPVAQAPVAAPAVAAPLPPPPLPPVPAVAAPVAPPDIQAMINSRMKQLLDQQLLELGESSTMSLDDLWRTNAELASGFRLVAQAHVHEQLGLPPPPPPSTIAMGPVQQPQPPIAHQAPPPLPAVANQPLPPPQQQLQPQRQAPRPQPQLSVQLPLGTPPPWAAKPPPSQDFGRAVQVANDVAAGTRMALDASMRGDVSGAQVQAAETAGKAAMLACLLGGDAAAAVGNSGNGGGGGVGVYLADLDPLDVRALARGNPAGVRRLYGEGFPFWCKQDGTRFATQVQLDAHMDLLFRRKRARREQKGAASREWYCTAEEWMTDFGRLAPPAGPGAGDGDGGGGGSGSGDGGGHGDEDGGVEEDGDPDGSKSCVPADERFSKCRICGDRFIMFYDNDEEEWMYRNACYVTVKGGGGEGGAGEEEEEEEEEEGTGAAGEGDEEVGMGGTRQIIVHKLCLDVSGLRDKEEITWTDLMPGTPRQRKRPADGDGALDAAFFGEGDDDEAEEGEEADSGEKRTVQNAASGSDHGDGEGDANGGGGSHAEDGGGGSDGPPLKRVKAEPGTGEEDGGGSDDAYLGGEVGGAGDMDEELHFEA